MSLAVDEMALDELAVNEMALDELAVDEMAVDDLTPHRQSSTWQQNELNSILT